VAAGVAPLVAAAPAALTAIAVAGACYLVHLGLAILRHSGRDEHVSSTAGVTGGAGRLLRHGIGVSALNPKSLVLFVAFLPQFARPSAPWPLGVQLAVLGLVWAAMSAVFYTALGRTAHKVFGARPRASRAVTRLAGAAMVVGGIALVGDQLLHAR
jgi:threonine/homoserine/homoserine lactone efflux protein